MKVGIVNASLLGTRGVRGSLLASDYLCPNTALEASIERLEKQAATIQTSLKNKRAELAARQEAEAEDIARGDLTLLGDP